MALRIGDMAPDFEAATTHGRIRLHEWQPPKPHIRIVPQPGTAPRAEPPRPLEA